MDIVNKLTKEQATNKPQYICHVQSTCYRLYVNGTFFDATVTTDSSPEKMKALCDYYPKRMHPNNNKFDELLDQMVRVEFKDENGSVVDPKENWYLPMIFDRYLEAAMNNHRKQLINYVMEIHHGKRPQ